MFDAIAAQGHWHRPHPARVPTVSVGSPTGREREEPARLFGRLETPRRKVALAVGGAVGPLEPRLFGRLPAPMRQRRVEPLGAAPGPLEPRMFGRIGEPLRAVALASVPGAASVAPRALFDPLVRVDLARRLVRRGGWTAAAGLFQAALIAGLAVVTAHLAATRRELPVMVDVKFVRTAAPRARPGPPPPPAAPVARRAVPAQPRPTVARRPSGPLALVQPHEIAATLAVPDPAEPRDAEFADGTEGGVEGGVIGGVVGGTDDASFGARAAPAPERAAEPARPVKWDRTMAAPALLAAPPLEYTQAALEREVEGTMVVECVVTVDGTVHDCHVLQSLPYMDRAVIANLERRRYRPATLDGAPLDVEYTFTIRFRLPN